MIPTIKKILYATDLSEKNSPYAFLYAVSAARSFGAKIICLHIVEPIPAYAIGLRVPTREGSPEELFRKQDMAEMEKRLQQYCRDFDAQIGGSCLSLVLKMLVRIGHPVEEIINTAQEEACDIIVVASHGKGLLKQTFLGSVSAGLLQRSRKPVFVIPVPSDTSRWDF
jgi:nucleotide-binding universal stress UspA family protein